MNAHDQLALQYAATLTAFKISTLITGTCIFLSVIVITSLLNIYRPSDADLSQTLTAVAAALSAHTADDRLTQRADWLASKLPYVWQLSSADWPLDSPARNDYTVNDRWSLQWNLAAERAALERIMDDQLHPHSRRLQILLAQGGWPLVTGVCENSTYFMYEEPASGYFSRLEQTLAVWRHVIFYTDRILLSYQSLHIRLHQFLKQTRPNDTTDEYDNMETIFADVLAPYTVCDTLIIKSGMINSHEQIDYYKWHENLSPYVGAIKADNRFYIRWSKSDIVAETIRSRQIISIGYLNLHFYSMPFEYYLLPKHPYRTLIFGHNLNIQRIITKFNYIHYNHIQTINNERDRSRHHCYINPDTTVTHTLYDVTCLNATRLELHRFTSDRLWDSFMGHMLELFIFRPGTRVHQFTKALSMIVRDRTKDKMAIASNLNLGLNKLKEQSSAYPMPSSSSSDCRCDWNMSEIVALSLFDCPQNALPLAFLHVRRGDKLDEDAFHARHQHYRTLNRYMIGINGTHHIPAAATNNVISDMIEFISVSSSDLTLIKNIHDWTNNGQTVSGKENNEPFSLSVLEEQQQQLVNKTIFTDDDDPLLRQFLSTRFLLQSYYNEYIPVCHELIFRHGYVSSHGSMDAIRCFLAEIFVAITYAPLSVVTFSSNIGMFLYKIICAHERIVPCRRALQIDRLWHMEQRPFAEFYAFYEEDLD